MRVYRNLIIGKIILVTLFTLIFLYNELKYSEYRPSFKLKLISMESLSSDPVIMAGNAPVGGGTGGFGGGDFLSAFLLASLVGGRGFGANYSGPALVEMSALLNEKAIGDTRRDVADSTSEIRESIHNQSLATSHEFRGVDNRLTDVALESLRGKYEGIIASMHSTNQLEGKVDRETNRLSRENREIQTSMDRQFCDLKHDMQAGFNDLEKREMQREIDTLRRQVPQPVTVSQYVTAQPINPCAQSASACDPALLAMLKELIGIQNPLFKK